MVLIKLWESCEAIIDEEVKDVRITDGKIAIVKPVFDENQTLEGALINDIYI